MPKPLPHEMRAEALRIYQEKGAKAASEATGVQANTIYQWARRDGVKPGYVQVEDDPLSLEGREHQRAGVQAWAARRREDVAPRLLNQFHELIDRMATPYTDFVGVNAKRVEYPSPPPKETRDLAVAAAVILDKLRLEEGKSTTHAANRVEVTQGGSPVDAAIADLLGQFDERTRVSGGGSPDDRGMEPAGSTGSTTP